MTDTHILDRMVAEKIEAAHREGWQDGYKAGREDGGCDFDYADPENDWCNSKCRTQYPTHWQPLPEPPPTTGER